MAVALDDETAKVQAKRPGLLADAASSRGLGDRWSSLVRSALEPVDGAWLAALRVLFGAVMAVSAARFLAYGWVERLFVAPTFHFKYWGFSWVQPLPAWGMQALFWGLLLCALGVMIGLWYRIAAWGLTVGLAYFQLIDVSTYLNHYYLALLLALLLATAPADRLGSWAAYRRGRKRLPCNGQVARGYLWLLRIQVGVVYVGAALAKAQPDWLFHAQPLRIWLNQSLALPLVGRLLVLPGAPWVMSWAGFVFDLSIVGLLLVKRVRPWAYAVLLVFHGLTRVLFPIGMFPVIMSVAALVFFEPDWPRSWLRSFRKLINLLRSRKQLGASGGGVGAAGASLQARGGSTDPTVSGRPGLTAQVGVGVGLVYLTVQLLLPLRCHAYGGNVLWHEQGMRFSWRVMVRAKGGSCEFIVRERGTGRRRVVQPRTYLTPMQEMEMAGQPDLILQLARHIAQDMRRRGWGPTSVQAVTRVSLNGRRAVPLVDPTQDLTQVQDGLGEADWIMPAPAAAPPHTRLVP